jgi:tetratricopeptide (TPR) repeat protein
MDNLRAALAWSVASGRRQAGAEIAQASMQVWWARSQWKEARFWLEDTFAHDRSLPDPLRAAVLVQAGFAAQGGNDLVAAAALTEESLDLTRALGDQTAIASTLSRLANIALLLGEHGHVEQCLDECLPAYRAMGSQGGLAYALCLAGVAALDQGTYEVADALLQESLEIYRALGLSPMVANGLHCLASVALAQQNLDRAEALEQESLALYRTLSRPGACAGVVAKLAWIAYRRSDYERAATLYAEGEALCREIDERSQAVVRGLGWVAYRKGDVPRARILQEEALRLTQEMDRRGIPYALTALAVLLCTGATDHARHAKAVCLFGAAERHRRTGLDELYHDQAAHADALGAARVLLGEPAFTQAWSAGQAMPLEAAIALALEPSSAAT